MMRGTILGASSVAALLVLTGCSGDAQLSSDQPVPEVTVTATATVTADPESPQGSLKDACAEWRVIDEQLGGDGESEFPYADRLVERAKTFDSDTRESRVLVMTAGAMYREGLEGAKTGGGLKQFDRWLDARAAARDAAQSMDELCR